MARRGLSPAVAERVQRMKEAGVITGYRASVDPAKVGAPMTAVIRMTSSENGYARLADLIRKTPEVLECHRLTGGDYFSTRAVVASMEHLESLIDRLAPYGQVTTSLVLSFTVPPRSITRLTWTGS